ncbi:hypothetical protein SAMN06298216_0790 [Spirosomataceae bacterium TFI 002]|nr:hypothetical protein SAMN06298216_0790 [Spirosomataceae bacterium TFI 002]
MKFKKLYFSILFTASAICGYSQQYPESMIMSTVGPVLEGKATLTQPINYTGKVVIIDFKMGASRFLNMDGLTSSQRANANAELSLVTIQFENQAFLVNDLNDAMYNGVKFQEVKIVRVVNTLQGIKEVSSYKFNGVIFSSLTSKSFHGGIPLNEATFKAEQVEIVTKVYVFSGPPLTTSMSWNFINNTGQ